MNIHKQLDKNYTSQIIKGSYMSSQIFKKIKNYSITKGLKILTTCHLIISSYLSLSLPIFFKKNGSFSYFVIKYNNMGI